MSMEGVDRGLGEAPKADSSSRSGMKVERRNTVPGQDPLSKIDYERRRSSITNAKGKVVFEMDGIEVPRSWSQLATDILASKYFRRSGVGGEGQPETSIRQVVHRIAHTIATYGLAHGYFAGPQDADAFEAELSYLLVHQYGAFNSPVWFNVGLYHDYGIEGSGGNWRYDPTLGRSVQTSNAYEFPQASACFIQRVDDSIDSICDSIKSEMRLFKYGSGVGSNFSTLRSKYEKLSGGGTSSGLMSFLRVFDRAAGSLKSGGTTRRAAKMVCLDMDHPEIVDFINWKSHEEEKAKDLIATGKYPTDFNGEAYDTVSGQNSNNSIRVTDDFMNAVAADGEWQTRFRTTGEVHKTYKARDLWRQIAESAWNCADPGVQYDTTINRWHTCPNTDKIRASNPCSEFMFLDNTACNLASLNLTKFLRTSIDGSLEFDVAGYRHAARIFFVAQEILVGLSSYPTAEIAELSYKYRPLGLGYANLGTLLMLMGLSYDSDEGRGVASALTAIMHMHAFTVSAEMAGYLGPFDGFAPNRAPMMKVMRGHALAAEEIQGAPKYLYDAAVEDARRAVELGAENGFRNAQATVLAPTGTIGLLMDCDTTGVEPDFALVKYKKLAGGGDLKIVNASVKSALRQLGYSPEQVEQIHTFALLNETVEGAPGLKPEHLPVFDCANRCGSTGTRFLAPMAHVKMMAAAQPFLSGAISKTVNLPSEATVEDIAEIYYQGWELGLKAVALYRDGCKASQPLSTKSTEDPIVQVAKLDPSKLSDSEALDLLAKLQARLGLPAQADVEKLEDALTVARSQLAQVSVRKADRARLPKRRHGMTQEAVVGGTKLFLRTGEYADGKVGEIFIDLHKEGAPFRAITNCFAIAVSMGLQYGVPLEAFVDQFTFTRFEPSGGVQGDEHVKTATSIVDYIFRTLGVNYLERDDLAHVKPNREALPEGGAAVVSISAPSPMVTAERAAKSEGSSKKGDAPFCDNCGSLTVRNGTCFRCFNCGSSMGCS